MSFNRKRTALACTYCRHRKRRCDAARPRCSTCVESGVECLYDDGPSQRIDTSGGSKEIIGRLRDIESILEGQAESIAALTATSSVAPSHSSSARETTYQRQRPARTAASPWQDAEQVFPSNDVAPLPPLTIPVRHKTSSSYLLSLPAMKALIGEYPTDLFFQLESRNPLPPQLSLEGDPIAGADDEIDRSMTDHLVSAFFATAHHSHPILDEKEFGSTYNECFNGDGFESSNVGSALVSVVCALGAIVSAGSEQQRNLGTAPPGMQFMQRALPTLIAQSSWSFSYEIQLPQALVLASIYFSYIVRPLQSWRLIYSASTILQFKLSGLGNSPDTASSTEPVLRVFWSCFLVECDRLAELELPRSGLQQLTDETSLPTCANLGDLESTCFLAEISIRRLLNRIHNSIYPRKDHVLTLSSTTLMTHDAFDADEIASIGSVCEELQRQLDLWHAAIPEFCRPPLTSEGVASDREAVLRIRYYAARHIIYRPFVLYLVAHPNSARPDNVVTKAGICIESCRKYLHHTSEIMQQPSQYTWTFSLSSLGAIVVLTLSSLNLDLKHLVPDIDELQSLAIQNIKPWAISSLEAVVSILEDMQKKQRLLSRV